MNEMERYKVEAEENWRDWCAKMPFIPFPAGWQIAPIPAFGGALVRFRVKLPDGREKSVYFDGFSRLGFCPSPYWEVYPAHGDVGRCGMNDVDELLALIAAPDGEVA